MPPSKEAMNIQEAALLKAFRAAGKEGLSTGQLSNLVYTATDRAGVEGLRSMRDWRRRKTTLLRMGYEIKKEKLPSGDYHYTLTGFNPPEPGTQLNLLGHAA